MEKNTTKNVVASLCPERSNLVNRALILIPVYLFLYISFIPAQQRSNLSGTVSSITDNIQLKNATVKLDGTKIETTTDQHGDFKIYTPVVRGVLSVSFLGYQTLDVPFDLRKNSAVKIVLQPNSTTLAEVVVSTGYQKLPKERATGSYVQVDSALLNRRVSSDILSRLEGVVPGLLFNRNTAGSAQGQTDISIRGTNTLFSNTQPLIVLDNFPYDGDINDINPNDIQSLTVLKDAAAASIWGVQSGNGVIVLTSKKGKQNQKLAIELNANVTVGNKPDLYYSPDFLNAATYIGIEKQLFNQGFYDSLIGDPTQVLSPVVQLLADERNGTISADAANSQINAMQGQDVRNDLSKYFYQRSVLQQYQVNFRGGGDKSDYYFSAGDDHGRGNEIGNNNNRITLAGNYNFYPIKNLQLSAGLNYVQTTAQNNSPVGNIYPGGVFANFLYPYAKLADANGNALSIPRDYNLEDIQNGSQTGLLDWQFRPLDELKNADNLTNSTDNRINLGARYRILPGLAAAVQYVYEKQEVNVNDYYSTATYYTRNLINEFSQPNPDGTYSYPVPVGGILQQDNAFLTSQHGRAELTYNHTLKEKHSINAILGAEVNETINSGSSSTAYGYDKNTETSYSQIDYADYFNLNPNGNSGAEQIPNSLGFSKTTDHYVSYFSNVAYTYDSRYTFSLSGRIDKSNLFGVATNQKSVPLYSTGFSWDAAKEKFYHVDWLPYLKFRVTYGYNANVNKTATAVTTLLQQSNSYYSGTPYDLIASPGNLDLRWEKVQMTNFGLDFGAKNQILTGSLEYYLKKATDLFGSSPLPPSTGLTSFFGNTASTSGHGFDVVINSKNLTVGVFSWTTNFLISHVLDKVTKYDDQAEVVSYLTSGAGNAGVITPLAGQPIYGIYSYKSGPLTHDTGDPQGYLNGKLSTDYASIIANTTVNDLYYNGPSRPTTFGSFRNNFTYKSFTLSANIIYKLGYYFRKTSTAISDANIVYGGVNQDYSQRWQKPGDELHTTVPSIQLLPSDGNRDFFYQYSQTLVDKGDNIRFQDLRLGYDIVKRPGSKFPFTHFQVFGYMNNIGILWRANHDHLDPDLYSGALPLPKTYSIGINSNF